MGVTKQAVQKRFVGRKADGDAADLADVAGWNRFTERAKNAVVAAVAQAQAVQHDHIGTEHLLLGLLTEPDGLAVKAIEAAGLSVATVREAAVATLGPAGRAVSGHVPFNPEAKKARELSAREALRLGHNFIGTEHILLALLEEPDGAGGVVLRRLGVTKAAAEQWILAALAEIQRGRREAAG
jgi:ATP-dependent Clp protease ATP-binding subunit ClpA